MPGATPAVPATPDGVLTCSPHYHRCGVARGRVVQRRRKQASA